MDGSNVIEIPDETIENLQVRLRRISGQILGIEKMLSDGRDCSDVVNQIAAARKALDQVGFKLVAAGLRSCLSDPVKAQESGYDITQLEKMFGRLA